MFSFSAPGGRASVSIISSNPDPDRRFNLKVSDGFLFGVQGIRELAVALNAFADEVDPPKVVTKAKPKGKAKS